MDISKYKPRSQFLGRLSSLVIALLMFTALTAAAFAQSAPATLVSDKDDYAPYEVAVLTGSGFLPGEGIDLSISIDDPATGMHIADYDWTQFNADANGGFVVGYEIPPEAADMTLIAAAMGLSSGLIAKTTFTDHGPSPVSASSYIITKNASHLISVSVNLAGATGSTTYTAATMKVNNTTDGTDTDLTLTSPGGNGNGTWNGSFQGECNKTYRITNVKVIWNAPGGGQSAHDHQSTQTPGGSIQVTTNACPVSNQAPVITCLDPSAQLNNIIGLLSGGSFSATVPIIYSWDSSTGKAKATFDFGTPGPSADDVTVDVANVTDADGDALTVNVTGPSSVTLNGPGAVNELLSTLTGTGINIHADDLFNLPVSSNCDLTVDASVIYNFVGFGSPLSDVNNHSTRTVKLGSTVPVKFRLYDAAGTEICTLLGSDPHYIGVAYNSGVAPAGDPTITDSGSSNENGINFRYSGTCGVDGNWIYNLQTKIGYYKNSTYAVEAMLNDGEAYEAYISIK